MQNIIFHIFFISDLQTKVVDNSFVNIQRYGDLSSLVWMESPLSYVEYAENELAHVYYSALNFRDIMLATGKISQKTAIGTFSNTFIFFYFFKY